MNEIWNKRKLLFYRWKLNVIIEDLNSGKSLMIDDIEINIE